MEFALAYDWRDSFDRYAGFFYSGANSAKPYERTRPGPPGGAPDVETEIADAIGFVHSIHWRCVEPDRMRRAREHFKAVVALNRQMWPIILARADDDKNWIPGPQQKNAAMPALQVTEAKVKAWRDAVELFDALLDGTKLLPHWRYQWGIDLNAFFQQPGDFDLVYWLTGPGAAPYPALRTDDRPAGMERPADRVRRQLPDLSRLVQLKRPTGRVYRRKRRRRSPAPSNSLISDAGRPLTSRPARPWPACRSSLTPGPIVDEIAARCM